MTLVGNLRALTRSTSTLSSPDQWLRTALSSGSSYSGKAVTVENSLDLIPVFAAVNRLSFSVGASPLVIYREAGDSRTRATNTPQWRLLHDSPNEEQSADEFWALVQSHLCLWGNAFIFKERNTLGTVGALWALKPSRVQVGRDKTARRVFVLDGKVGEAYTETDILHIRGLSSDGLVGYSPIQLARNLLGNSMSMEEFQGSFWANGAWPGVVLKHPNRIGDEGIKNLKASWNAAHKGGARAGSTAILEEGVEPQTMTMPLEDAQFIEQARFNDLRIAQMFGLPPAAIGAKSGDSLTYATVEGNAIAETRNAIRPWSVRIEKSLQRDPDLFIQGGDLYPKFNLDALLRGDLKTRYESYEIGIRAGVLTVNEARGYEDLDPRDTPDTPPPEISA